MHVDLFFRRLQRRGQKFAANHFSSIQIIVFYYILMTVLSLVLFYMPIFREPDSHVSFVDMLFMAISTVSVTGLSTFDINSVFNDNGIILLEILFQVGGLGIMMISTAFVIFSKRRITLKQRQLIMTDMNQPRLSGIVRLIRITFAILIWFQLLFGTFFSIYIDQDDVRKSVVVFMLSLGMCFFCIVFLSATEEQTLISIIIEVTSAFGTTGLSLGITGDLSVVGKITIATLMFIGRIGMLYTLMLFVPKETRDLGYEYPSEKIIIG